jgi:hypothetical protein
VKIEISTPAGAGKRGEITLDGFAKSPDLSSGTKGRISKLLKKTRFFAFAQNDKLSLTDFLRVRHLFEGLKKMQLS